MLERDQVIQRGRLIGIKKFEGETEDFIFYNITFIDYKLVKRFENGSDTSGFRGLTTARAREF